MVNTIFFFIVIYFPFTSTVKFGALHLGLKVFSTFPIILLLVELEIIHKDLVRGWALAEATVVLIRPTYFTTN